MIETTGTYNLTEEQISFYQENGYLVIRDFISAADINKVLKSIEETVQGDYRNYLDLHVKVPEVRSLIVNPNLLDVCDRLHQHRMFPIGSIFFFCKPGNPLELGSLPHQDNYAPKAPYGAYFVAAIAFDDADTENGALIVYPRTHKLGDLPSSPKKNFEFDEHGRIIKTYPIGNEVAIPEGYKPLQLAYAKGSLILLHGHTIHEAKRNVSNHWRRKIYFHFIKEGAPFWPGISAQRHLIDRPPSRVLVSV